MLEWRVGRRPIDKILSCGGVLLVLSGSSCAEEPASSCDKCDGMGGNSETSEEKTLFSGTGWTEDCSAGLFRFADQPLSQKALVLTNGHCIDLLEPEGAIADTDPGIRLKFYKDDGEATEWLVAESLLYATMEGTDLAILRLGMTFEQLSDDGLRIRTLASERPDPGTPVVVAAAREDWKTECEVFEIVPTVREFEYSWQDVVSLGDECETFYGTSGAPVIAAETDLIVAVNNTGVLEDGEPCSLDHPCEVDEDGEVSFRVGASYAQQTADLYLCIDDDFELDLNREGCPLPALR